MDVTRIEDIPGLRELWASTTGVPEVCVALLDGIVDVCHPCFRGANLQLANPLRRARLQGAAFQGHGTAIASVLFGRHDSKVKGVAPHCRGLFIPIYAPDGPSLRCSQADLALAIREAVRLGAHVINVSGGELTPQGAPSRDLADAVQYCTTKGRLLVAAAGNDGCAECLHVPSALPSVLTVGAMEPDGTPLDQSNWGKAYQAQGIVAPGRNLVVASPGDDYTVGTGTSLATPLVAGVAALLASLQRRYTRRVDLALVRRLLLASAIGCDEQPTDQCERLLVGRLNVARAHYFLLRALKGLPMTATAEPVVEPSAAAPASAAVPAPPTEPAVPVRTASVMPSIIPADCACGGNGKATQYVYVIGDRIGYDFGSRVRQFSLQANADADYPRLLSDPAAFLRYLLGSRKFGTPLNGNLHDAKSVYWVLYRENCPLYAVQPHGDFSEAVYKALITFLIETTSFGFYNPGTDVIGPDGKPVPGPDGKPTKHAGGEPIPFYDPDLDIRYDCLMEYFDCYGGQSEPLEPGSHDLPPPPDFDALLKADQQMLERFFTEVYKAQHPQKGKPATSQHPKEGQHHAEEKPSASQPVEEDPLADLALFMSETPSRASKVAIAGALANKRVTLADGRQVEVIHPDLRGMSNWNTLRLFRVALRWFTGPQNTVDADAWGFVARVVSRLYELIRNDGKAPQDRAMNWAATAFLQEVRPLLRSRIFRDLLGREAGLRMGAVNDIQVHPASCQESGGEYEVEISLFNVAEILQGLTVLASTVDVSDVVPVTLGKTRVFNKR